jgi:hypothetical protein
LHSSISITVATAVAGFVIDAIRNIVSRERPTPLT